MRTNRQSIAFQYLLNDEDGKQMKKKRELNVLGTDVVAEREER